MSEGGPGPKAAITPVADVRDYFRETVETIRQRQRLDVRPATQLYLINLLVDYALSAEPSAAADGGRVTGEPLAFMLMRAIEAPPSERVRELRRMGDTALYVSGFFSDSLQRQLVDIDYYASMGGRAYGALGDLSRDEQRGVFRELALKFLRVVDLFSEISERTLCTSNAGLLRLYERYVRTGSARLRALLEERGVIASSGTLLWQ
jgi:hypothetical protein